MRDPNDPTPNPETPWEFLPHDDPEGELLDDDPDRPAEAEAMHIETRPPRLETDLLPPVGGSEPPDVTVHYFEDEHPEIPDRSEPRVENEETADVEDLLVRQHYLSVDEPDQVEAEESAEEAE